MSVLYNRSAGNNNWSVALFNAAADTGSASQGVGIGATNSNEAITALIQGNYGNSDNTAYVNGNTAFIVARITRTLSESNQVWPVVDVWVDPAMDADLASVAVGGGESTFTRQWGGLAGVNTLVLYSHQNNALTFDEIRIGATQVDVMPVVPEPASLMLFGVGALALVRRRRN